MSDTRLPPTEAELKECYQWSGAIDHNLVIRFAAEIVHLRAVCRSEAESLEMLESPERTIKNAVERLRAASEGRR